MPTQTIKKFTFVADFTYDPKRPQPLQILELGDLPTSSLSGLYFLNQDKPTINQDWLNQLKKSYPDAIFIEDQSFSDGIFQLSQVDIHDFATNQKASYNLQNPAALADLVKSSLFLRNEDFRPLLVCFKGAKLSYEEQITIESLKAQHPNVLIVNFPSGGLYNACNNKAFFLNFCTNYSIHPKTLLIKIDESSEETLTDFMQSCETDKFIIKPINRSRGLGICIKTNHEILSFINRLKQKRIYGPKIMRGEPSYWAYTDDQYLLLQAFSPSKAIEYKHQQLLPTGRAVIEATQTDDHITQFKFLGGYWKLPRSPMKGSVSDNEVISIVEKDDSFNVTEIAEDDWQAITSNFNQYFKPIVNTMFMTKTKQLITQLQQHPDPVMRKYADVEFSSISSNKENQQETDIKKLEKRYKDVVSDYFSHLSYGSPNSMKLINGFKSALYSMQPRSLKSICINTIYKNIGFFNYQEFPVSIKQNLKEKLEKEAIIRGLGYVNC